MKTLLVAGSLLLALPAAAQAPVCTIVGTTVTNCQRDQAISPAEAAAILTKSVPPYVYVERGDGPRVFILASDGPYDPPMSPARRLDGSWLADPPWMMTTYLGHRGVSGARRGAAGFVGHGSRPVTPVAPTPWS